MAKEVEKEVVVASEEQAKEEVLKQIATLAAKIGLTLEETRRAITTVVRLRNSFNDDIRAWKLMVPQIELLKVIVKYMKEDTSRRGDEHMQDVIYTLKQLTGRTSVRVDEAKVILEAGFELKHRKRNAAAGAARAKGPKQLTVLEMMNLE